MKLQKNTLNDQLLMQQDEAQDMIQYKFRQRPQFQFNNNNINHHYNNARTNSNPIIINYDHIIDMQSSMIQALYKQCTLLRQHVKHLQQKQKLLHAIIDGHKKNNKHQQQNSNVNINNVNDKDKDKQNNSDFIKPNSQKQQSLDQMTKIIESSILNQISTVLNIPQQQMSRVKVIHAIKRLKWEREKRLQPIFIEIKTEVRIPLLVEVIVQKIVYKDRIVVQQVPVFREKIVEKFGLVIQDNSNTIKNSNNYNSPKISTSPNYNNNARSPKNHYNNSNTNNNNSNSNKPYVSPRQFHYENNAYNKNSNSNQPQQQRFYKSNKYNNNHNNNNNKYEEHQHYQNQPTPIQKQLSKHTSTKTLLKNPSNKTLYYQNNQSNNNKRNHHNYYDDDRRR